MLGWGGGDVNVPCTCTMLLPVSKMFLASQRDVFGLSARCFRPVSKIFWPVSKMFLASQQGVFGQSARGFQPVSKMFLASQRDVFGQSTGASHRLGRSSGCFWQVTRMFVDSWTISCWSRPSPWPWSIMFFCVSVRGELKMPCIRTTTHHCSFHECLTWQTFVFQSFCCFVFDWAGATERKWKKSLEKISFVLLAFKKCLALVRLAFCVFGGIQPHHLEVLVAQS